MKISYSWLKDHLETTQPMEALVEKLEEIAFEVDWVSNPRKSLRDITVAEIQEVENHPQADKLHVCRVFDGQKVLQIVCGAPNVYKGMKTALVHVGGFVPALGETLKAAKIRGVESQAMMCSPRELQMSDEHEGILDITSNTEAVPGKPLVEALGLDDSIIDVSITPNRGDCLSVRGLARELAAAGMGTLKPLSYEKFGVAKPVDLSGLPPLPLNVRLESPACDLFCGVVLEGLSVGESPEWMQQRLQVAGQKSINALVDITNFLCFDLGQPMHAYDRQTIRGDLHIRQAREGETLDLLNDTTCTLCEKDLVIADDEASLILAGVMGGKDSGSTESTTQVLLEAAHFDAVAVTLAGQRHNLRSESRSRFERGLDRTQTPTVLAWAVALVQSLCGGQCVGATVQGSASPARRSVTLTLSRLHSLSGDASLTLTEAERTLTALGFTTLSCQEETLTVEVPSWRNDVEGDGDLMEEILRMRGYHRLAYKPLPPCIGTVQRDPVHKLKRTLCERGLNEVYTLPFCSAAECEAFGDLSEAVEVLKPLNSEMAYLRPSLILSLLKVVAYNRSRQALSGGIFEVESVFSKGTDPQAPREQKVLAGVRYGATAPNWLEKSRNIDIFDAKADLVALLEACKITSFQTKTEPLPPYYHPYTSGTFLRGREILGHFGELHPSLAKKLDMDLPVVIFELLLSDKVTAKMGKTDVQPLNLSPLQPLTRDFAFVVDRSVPAQQLVDTVRKTDGRIVSVDVFDVYEKIDQGKKSVALKVRLQPTNQTLTDDELQQWSQKVVQQVKKKCGGVLR